MYDAHALMCVNIHDVNALVVYIYKTWLKMIKFSDLITYVYDEYAVSILIYVRITFS